MIAQVVVNELPYDHDYDIIYLLQSALIHYWMFKVSKQYMFYYDTCGRDRFGSEI